MDRLALLKSLSFGTQVAEDEINELASYFVQTDQWNKIFNGDIDIVRGEKGAGKSAIYLLLNTMSNKLFDRGVVMVSAENPQGTTVFKDLIADPPTSEAEFIVLWKIYLLTIIAHELRSIGLSSIALNRVYGALEDANLLERELNLSGLLRTAQSFSRKILGSKIEAGIELDPVSGGPSGIIGRISLAEPMSELRGQGITSIDGLFAVINSELRDQKYNIWVLLDRLDVAFAASHELEANAIRALVRVYGDLRGLDNIALKIFLREDIWKRITAGGLREASHLIRYQIMDWNQHTLLNLLMRRILNNQTLITAYGVDRENVLADLGEQEKLFRRLFPLKVEQGNNPETFKWMVTRCADGTGKTTPRELIHLLNTVRDEEIKRLELGGKAPDGDQLFDRSVFKTSMSRVSRARVDTYLYAEYADEKPYIDKLMKQKAEQTPDSLAALWGIKRANAMEKAQQLVDLGFFELRGTPADPTYWVPFLYRDALNLIQGKADAQTAEG